jgi:hypothetical protein
MAAAHPLPLDDELNVRPLDLDACDPDERAGIEAALARLADGTAVLVPQEEVEAEVEAQRRRAG